MGCAVKALRGSDVRGRCQAPGVAPDSHGGEIWSSTRTAAPLDAATLHDHLQRLLKTVLSGELPPRRRWVRGPPYPSHTRTTFPALPTAVSDDGLLKPTVCLRPGCSDPSHWKGKLRAGPSLSTSRPRGAGAVRPSPGSCDPLGSAPWHSSSQRRLNCSTAVASRVGGRPTGAVNVQTPAA